jgi:PTS system mannose-specific IIA component
VTPVPEQNPAVLVISHGRFAEEIVRAAATIVGTSEALEAISIGWNDDVQDAQRKVEAACARLGKERPVLVLTDMFGGTPTNLALSLLSRGRLEVVTGVNLPMLIKCLNLRGEMPFDQVCRKVAEQGRDAIRVASDVLAPPPADGSGSGA